jgi:DNA topoisomerase-1
MMPSMTEEFVASLHAHHIYTVYEIANLPQTRIAKTLDISDEMSRKIQAEAADVLELLRRRSELRKFVRSHLPYRRGRTPAKVLRGFFDAGINEIGDLAGKNPADLGPLKLSAEEAALLIDEAQAIMNERVLREFGVPAVSLKKYFKAGIIRPEDFCFLHPAYLSLKTGINVETIQKHAGKVCEGLGVRAPEKVSKKQLEKGRKELLAVPGLGEAALEKLYRAGVVDAGSLLLADPETLEAKTGIAAERVGAFIEALKASYSE